MESYHKYPPSFLKNPHLMRWIYLWNNLILQRNWHTKAVLDQLLKSLPTGSNILDAGSGEGHHILQYAPKFPALNFYGVDIEQQNIEFTELYAKALNLQNTTFIHSDLATSNFSPKIDLTYLVGVLQYIPKDDELLKKLYDNLNDNGQLFIYSPVNERTVIRYIDTLRNKYFYYEKVQNRCRIYKRDALITQIKNAGFKIETVENKFGTLGIISHELYSIIILLRENTTSKLKLTFLFTLLILIFPTLLLLKLIDFHTNHTAGNSVVIIAKK